jgi:hypothetical protein
LRTAEKRRGNVNPSVLSKLNGIVWTRVLENQKAFYLAASHRQIKNNFWASFLPAGRQVRLCGENLILEKSLNAS